MLRDVNLIAHLPPFLQKFEELKAILETENPEIQIAMDESERLKNNGFIKTADSEGLKRFEKLLGIYAPNDMDLETRRSIVLSTWNNNERYTFETFCRKLEAIAGNGNYEVQTDFENYSITIDVRLDSYGQVDEFNKLISYIMPANLIIYSNNNIIIDTQNTFKIATVFEVFKSISI